MPKPEEFATAIHTRIMTDRDLGHAETRQFELLRHFDTDDTASRFQGNRIENISAEQAEIAIHVTNREVENKSHDSAVYCADPDAIPGIRAFNLITVHQIDVRPEFGQQVVHFANIVLTIAVGVEDEIFLCVLET